MSTARPGIRPGQEAPDAIGIIGLGNMGAAIGQRLAERGPVLGFRRTGKPTLDGVTRAESLAEFRHLDRVILCLPSDMASREVCGGVKAMLAGQSLLLIGGEAADIAAAEPVLAHLSQRRLVFGLRGSGMTAKIANNAVSHAVMVVLVEATALCQVSGVDPERFTELLADPGAGLTRPLTHRLRERVFEGNFAGGMSTANALKDSQLALEAAQQARVPLYAISGAHTAYEMAESRGLGDLDYAAIAQLWAEWIGRPLGPAGQAESETRLT
jgi:3-hydroxyisobutyrate dehydrogenase-like beta-hydroxyacid dehydrogenase